MSAGRLCTAGVDLGGTKLLGLVLDSEGRVGDEQRLPTPEGADALLDAFVTLVGQLRDGVAVESVGVGAPGLVDRAGVLHTAPNLPGVRDLAVKAELERRLGLPVQVDNDATCAAWGERELGAGKSGDDVLVVTLGTGIGGGIISDGNLYR